MGSKATIVKHYPKPIHNTIVEPFAGTAKYALEYFEKEVILIDKFERIVNIWHYLQKCSQKDIQSLPRLNAGDDIRQINFDCQEQKDLMGFIIGFGSVSPRNKVTSRSIIRPNHINYTINRIAGDLYKIKHWQIKCGDYKDAPNIKATWFIDPPYQIGGHAYIHSNKNINYLDLSEWCKSRQGQTIVCEGSNADWLDFQPLVEQKILTGKYKESIWINNLDI